MFHLIFCVFRSYLIEVNKFIIHILHLPFLLKSNCEPFYIVAGRSILDLFSFSFWYLPSQLITLLTFLFFPSYTNQRQQNEETSRKFGTDLIHRSATFSSDKNRHAFGIPPASSKKARQILLEHWSSLSKSNTKTPHTKVSFESITRKSSSNSSTKKSSKISTTTTTPRSTLRSNRKYFAAASSSSSSSAIIISTPQYNFSGVKSRSHTS